MIAKPKPNGMREVYVYDPTLKRKRYVGQRATRKGAELLEAEKILEFAGDRDAGWTVERFAVKFLTDYHGPNTKRRAPTTHAVNEQNLRRFRAAHGARLLSSITRDEAYLLAIERPHEARTIAAMFAAAVDKGFAQLNPFARLDLPRSRGRADIDPLTENEVEAIAAIALVTAGHWGQEFRALILWMGWTGMRPGEVCALKTADLDWDAMTVRIAWSMRNNGTPGPVKGERARTIPLADEAAAAARTLRRTSGLLFRTPTGKLLRPNSLRHYWVPVRTAFTAQLVPAHWLRRRLVADPDDQLVPYELRHHCGSMLADRGLSSADIAAYMGNSVRVCEETYIHAYRDRQHARLRAALNQSPADLDPGVGQTTRQETS